MPFKISTPQQVQTEIRSRDKEGLSYINSALPVYKPQKGDNAIRIVPPLSHDKDADAWGFEVRTYFLYNRLVLSSSTFDKGTQDPVNKHYFHVKESDPEQAKKFSGSRRYIMYVLDMNDSYKLKIWAAPFMVLDEIANLTKTRSGDLISLECPNQGQVIVFKKQGDGIATRYNCFALDGSYPITEDICAHMNTFAEILNVPTQEDLQNLLRSGDNEDGYNEDDRNEPGHYGYDSSTAVPPKEPYSQPETKPWGHSQAGGNHPQTEVYGHSRQPATQTEVHGYSRQPIPQQGHTGIQDFSNAGVGSPHSPSHGHPPSAPSQTYQPYGQSEQYQPINHGDGTDLPGSSVDSPQDNSMDGVRSRVRENMQRG